MPHEPQSSPPLPRWLLIEELAQLLAPPRSVTGTDPRRGVLLVDDDVVFLRTLSRELGLSYRVVSASSAATALEKLQDQAVSILVSDYDLGSGDTGLDLLRHVQKERPRVRRVLMSSHRLEHLAQEPGSVVERFVFKGTTNQAILDCLVELSLPQ